MAGNRTIRTLVTKLVLDSRSALNGLKAYDRAWKSMAKSVESSAAIVEKAATRAMAALGDVAGAAAMARTAAAGAGRGGGGGGGARPARTESPVIDRMVREGQREAAKREREQAQRDRQAAREQSQRSRAHDRGERASGISAARSAGLAAGSQRVTDATRGLGALATASDKAKAKVADLTSTVERNRKEIAALREQAVKTGDADGTLAARMQGLSVATGKASQELGVARRELRQVDGGLIDAVKNAGNLSGRFDALKVAAGNLISGAVTSGLGLIRDGLVGSAKAAIDFESSMADVKKVLNDADLKNFDVLSDGVKRVSRDIGVMPNEVAALTASLAQSGIAGEELLTTAEDASKLAVAFGVNGEQAGQALAKLRTGLGLSRDEVNSLTGTINVLSNNLAATAPEITDAVQRVGSIGKANNISAQSVAALTTAMIASGAGADVAATGTKNFILALTGGEAATKKEREALAALGLTAEELNARIVKGGKSADDAITDVVTRIGKLQETDRSAVLRELFGKESIGAIGPLATNIDLLTKSFNLAGDAAEAAGSVEKEFAARSSTTDQAIKKLKASVAVLAIEFGDALLPYINDVVKFLTSPEGQEWGRGAVEKAVGAVTTLASGVKSLAEFFGFLVDKIGGAGVAVVGLGVALTGLTGPMGAVLAAGVAMGAGIAMAVRSAVNSVKDATGWLDRLAASANKIRQYEAEQELKAAGKQVDANVAANERERRVQAATDKWEAQERRRRGVTAGSEEDFAITRRAAKMRDTLLTGKGAGRIGTFDERIKSFEASTADPEETVPGLAQARAEAGARKGGSAGDAALLAGMSPDAKQATFNDLVSRRKSLKPSEQKMLRALSKDLDQRIPGAGHKATKMDRMLANLDPSLRGVLTAGGETDAGGDAKVHDDVLSRAVYARATGSGGGGGGGASLGPGPSISNVDNRIMVSIQQAIDARGNGTAAENLRSSGQDVAQQTGQEVVRLTGARRVAALRNAGGRMV